MAKDIDKLKLSTVTNTALYRSFEKSREKLIENSTLEGNKDKSKVVNKACEQKDNISEAYINEERFKELIFSEEYERLVRKKRPKQSSNAEQSAKNDTDGLIYRIVKFQNDYTIETGRYIGSFALSNDGSNRKLVITTGYSNALLSRMLNACLGVYSDSSISEKAQQSDNLYSMLLHLMFLISLKKVASIALPQKYVTRTERGYGVRGNVDINAYINYDLPAADKKITSRFQERSDVQPIIDVLNAAMKKCRVTDKGAVLPSAANLESYLRENASPGPVPKSTVNNILKERCLSNSLYSSYKLPLRFAQMILGGGETDNNEEGIDSSQYLIDSALLWEMYLYKLMQDKLTDWLVKPQENIKIYENTFFAGTYYPDFVLMKKGEEETGPIYILDAKFKTMEYNPTDVDREDIQQVHFYSYYCKLKYGSRYKGTALIYPTKKDLPENTVCVDRMYGIDSAAERFGIFAIRDVDSDKSSDNSSKTLENSENVFIEELTAFLNA